MSDPILRGEVYWVELDKPRPSVVVSPNPRNLFANDVIIIPCSSHLRPMRWHVRLPRGEGGVPVTSMVKCELVTTASKEWFGKRLGVLTASRMVEIERALLSAVGIERFA